MLDTISPLSPIWAKIRDLPVSHGRGSTVTSVDGLDYLDFTSGIGVVSTGHCHPRVVSAIQEQAARLVHGQVNNYQHPLLVPLADKLRQITPPRIEQFFYTNSGAEAVEGAVKLARWATGRPHLVVFDGGFHGRTAQTMAMSTSKVGFRGGHSPLPAGVFVAPYPYPLAPGRDDAVAVDDALRGLRRLLTTQTSPDETAAMFIEPVQGEGGYFFPPPSFLLGIQEICREHGILLVVDEIQSGMGRTGDWFASDFYELDPDIITIAKGVASGYPLAVVGASASVMAKWPPGSHGGTYGGGALACAAGLATIETIERENLLQNAQVRGAELLAGLHKIAQRNPRVVDVRGRGLMLAIEIVDHDATPSGASAVAMLQHAQEHGRLLLTTCGPNNNVIRVLPPLVVTEEETSAALAALEQAAASLI